MLVHATMTVVDTGETTGASRAAAPPRLRPSRRPLSRGLIELIGLAVGASFIAAVALDHPLSNDVFWQLASGQWILAHHAMPGLDAFSYTEPHRRWITDEWGSGVALAGLFRLVGSPAYSLFAILTGALSLGCTLLYARALGARGGRVAAILIVLAIGMAGFMATDRGLSFSLIWLPLELLILAKARTRPRWLLWLPLLCLLWSNTHGSILIGLAILGVELAWSVAPDRMVERLGGTGRSPFGRWLGLAALASVAAACITPYGPGLLSYDLRVAGNGQIAQYIAEWNSPDFHSLVSLCEFVAPLIILVVVLRRRSFPVLETTLAAAFFVAGLRADRVAIYLMVVAAGLVAALPARPAWGRHGRGLAGAGLIALMLAIVSVPALPAGSVSSSQPSAAFTFLAHDPGRIFTEYTWGDYAISRHRATFADGRTDLFAGPVLTEFFALTELSTDPDPILSRADVSYVVWDGATPLGQYLQHDSHWVVVDRTSVALVFARRSLWERTHPHI
jgi:hypothetical protein